MSGKSGEGKSLKGVRVGSAATIDIRALVAALNSSGLSLNNVTLQNAFIYSGQMEDVAIGGLTPSP